MRIEKDFIGEKQIPKDALYGINSVRACENFPNESPFSINWYKAVGITKAAVYITYKKFSEAVKSKSLHSSLKIIDERIVDFMIETAEEISSGRYFDNFIVPAVQGGAGTSINMNINEIIANVVLEKLGKPKGNYETVDPFEDANIYQSTNDVIPTSLKVAVMKLLETLEEEINKLRFKFEEKEREFRNYLRIGYTQLQEAVPSSFGMLFGAYNEALSRDWWRISKCFERIKVVNIGGSAIGTSIAVPKFMVMETVRTLQEITKLPVTGSENLHDATSNLDSFVEIHGILKSHAVNLEKIVSDIRLLASNINNTKEFEIPDRQTGSSIMPGKVNPVIPEYVISVTHKVYANDMLISSLASQGQLDLNAYTPQIGDAILESLELLISANNSLLKNLIAGIKINKEKAEQKMFFSSGICTALIPFIGYKKATEVAQYMKDNNADVFSANDKLKLVNVEKLKEILSIDNLLKAGFSIYDIMSSENNNDE